ncbi:ArsR/SmtB family transcription factor [Methanoregula sp. UBA64]|jgi:DNA-binding transcriptional ArsR family regulator|uniref:ArsR/SmtB family transcription factor n=1 Tax=Methanoregula sp. UBA64 TaxID=1915554 RepID=UPI0025E724D0|nr:winged helix-turn-helix domain-containing protein [Methanoregula sp. UBA64]
MTENVVVLEPGDERAQKIAKAMGSQTASDILTLLATGAKSLTDITEQLKIPLTTAKYHAENLLDAGLIIISETKYSVKGREVKMYALTDQLLIVAPKQTNVRSLLLKYTSLFGIVVVGTLAVIGLEPLLAGQGMWSETAPAAMTIRAPATGGAENQVYAAKAMADTNVLAPAFSPDLALAFFCGGVLVIFVLLCYEAYLWRKRR